jgi:hypothetical protein
MMLFHHPFAKIAFAMMILFVFIMLKQLKPSKTAKKSSLRVFNVYFSDESHRKATGKTEESSLIMIIAGISDESYGKASGVQADFRLVAENGLHLCFGKC